MDILSFLQANPGCFLIMTAIFSLFVGSFLNVVIYRLPIMCERNWQSDCREYLNLKPEADMAFNLCLPHSHCPRCHHTICPWHNIPLLSYLWLRGKCAKCKNTIPLRYPFVELLTAIVSVLVAYKFGVTLQTAGVLIFSWFAIALIFIDFDSQILPDELTLSLLWVGLFLSIFNVFCSSHDAIIAAIISYLFFASIQLLFQYVLHKDALGQGDFKYLAAIATFTGWQILPILLLIASLSGIICILAYMILHRRFKSVPFAFGPYLALAGWICLMWGQEIMQYYTDFVQGRIYGGF